MLVLEPEPVLAPELAVAPGSAPDSAVPSQRCAAASELDSGPAADQVVVGADLAAEPVPVSVAEAEGQTVAVVEVAVAVAAVAAVVAAAEEVVAVQRVKPVLDGS